MITISQLAYDVNRLVDQRQAQEDEWEENLDYGLAYFAFLTEQGMEPELAADLADDGLPICEDPPEVATDGTLVVEWPGMYAEAA